MLADCSGSSQTHGWGNTLILATGLWLCILVYWPYWAWRA